MFKDHSVHRVHMDGIYRIVALRGGIDRLRATMPLMYWRVILYSPKHTSFSQISLLRKRKCRSVS
jgi:hypothetical protein